jgi:hypothetical protein
MVEEIHHSAIAPAVAVRNSTQSEFCFTTQQDGRRFVSSFRRRARPAKVRVPREITLERIAAE